MTVSRAAMLAAPERPTRAYPVSYLDFGSLTTAPVALGVAQEALEAVRELVLSKKPMSGTTTLATSQAVQEKFARAEMLVYSSRLLLDHAGAQAVEHGVDGGPAISSLIRLATAAVAENATAAVDITHILAGSSTLSATSRLDRCFRDVHAVGKHVSISSSHFETVGDFLLGGKLSMRR